VTPPAARSALISDICGRIEPALFPSFAPPPTRRRVRLAADIPPRPSPSHSRRQSRQSGRHGGVRLAARRINTTPPAVRFIPILSLPPSAGIYRRFSPPPTREASSQTPDGRLRRPVSPSVRFPFPIPPPSETFTSTSACSGSAASAASTSLPAGTADCGNCGLIPETTCCDHKVHSLIPRRCIRKLPPPASAPPSSLPRGRRTTTPRRRSAGRWSCGTRRGSRGDAGTRVVESEFRRVDCFVFGEYYYFPLIKEERIHYRWRDRGGDTTSRCAPAT